MNRREAMLSGLAAFGASAILCETGASSRSPTAVSAKATDPTEYSHMPLVNQAQARKIMEQYKVDGLIALQPENVYYLSNTQPLTTKMGYPHISFATLTLDDSEPSFFGSSLAQNWDIANRDRWLPEFLSISAASDSASYIGPDARPLTERPEAFRPTWLSNGADGFTLNERKWLDFDERVDTLPTIEWALAKALEESGMDRGRLAVDDIQIANMLKRIGKADNIEFIEGDNIFRRIRVIKSKREIELMRIAAQANGDAILATSKMIEVGMTHRDLENIFLAEAAKLGNRSIFLLAGFLTGGLPNGEITSEMPILIDAVSEHMGYCGDFARTFLFDDPDRYTKSILSAQMTAREAVFEKLAPGVKYSEIRQVGNDAFKKAGGTEGGFIVNPHSVGLQHTDQPYSETHPWRGSEDIVLEKNMTLTVDLPYIEVGVMSAHHEDLLVITDNGFAPLTDNFPDVLTP